MVDIKEVLEKEFENNTTPVDRDKVRSILAANNGARQRTDDRANDGTENDEGHRSNNSAKSTCFPK